MAKRRTPDDRLCALHREPDAEGICPGARCDFWSNEGCLLGSLGLSLQETRETANPLLAPWRIVPGERYAASSSA